MLVAPAFDSYLLEEIADRMRPEDLRELRLVTPDVPIPEQLAHATAGAREVYLLWPEKSYYPIGIVGLTESPLHGWGSIWMVCTTDVTQHRLAVRETSEKLLSRWRALYEHGLHCLADQRNTLHIRWLDHLGLAREGGVTIRNTRFIYFTYRRAPHV